MIYKLIEIKVPLYLINWFIVFLSDRKFKVKVNDFTTIEFGITTGVPQGAVLSATLFSIFINGIPTNSKKNKMYSLLYADDLVFYYIYRKNPNAASIAINKHLISIQNWLNNWRLKMAPHKCNYLVFTNSNADLSSELNLKLNGIKLQHDNNPTFLGIRFDHHLTFKNQVEYLKKTCIQRLNILKILAYKTWKLNIKTLTQIYNVLIRSVIEYTAILVPVISVTNMNTLQIIQNNALRIILKKPLITRTRIESLHEEAKIEMLEVRLLKLRNRYIHKALTNSNPIMKELINDFINYRGGRNNVKKTLLCEYYDELYKSGG